MLKSEIKLLVNTELNIRLGKEYSSLDMKEKDILLERVISLLGNDIKTVGELYQKLETIDLKGLKSPVVEVKSPFKEKILLLAMERLDQKVYQENNATLEEILLLEKLTKLHNIGKLHTFN